MRQETRPVAGVGVWRAGFRGGLRQSSSGGPKLTCKPRSVPAFWKGLTLQSSLRLAASSFSQAGGDHLSRPTRCRAAQAAYPRLGGPSQPAPIGCYPTGIRLCLALLQTGVAWPSTLLPTSVVSYTTLSPSPRGPRAPRQSSSLWPSSGRSPRPGHCPASSSLERGLSSAHRGKRSALDSGTTRSPGQLGTPS